MQIVRKRLTNLKEDDHATIAVANSIGGYLIGKVILTTIMPNITICLDIYI